MPKLSDNSKKISQAIEVISRYGQIDGAHHKQWVLDQALRALFGGKLRGGHFTATKEYKQYIIELRDGEDGPETYGYDEGIPP